MIVTFQFPSGDEVSYGFGDCRVPVTGELVSGDGSDDNFPNAVWRVADAPMFIIGPRGPNKVFVRLVPGPTIEL